MTNGLCTDVTNLVRQAFPLGFSTLLRNLRGVSWGSHFLGKLADVVYFYTQFGGSTQRFRQIMSWAFDLGAREQGRAARRIPSAVIDIIDDLESLWIHSSPRSFVAFVNVMASRYTQFLGSVGVLRFLRSRGFSNIAGIEVLVQGTPRRIDVVLNTGAHLLVEVKSWTHWMRAPRSQWIRWGNQTLRDLVLIGPQMRSQPIAIFQALPERATQMIPQIVGVTSDGRFIRSMERVRQTLVTVERVNPETGVVITETITRSRLRELIMENLMDGIGASLFRRHQRRMTTESLLRRLRNLTPENFRNRGSSLLAEILSGPGGFSQNKTRLIEALENLNADSSSFLFIDPS